MRSNVTVKLMKIYDPERGLEETSVEGELQE